MEAILRKKVVEVVARDPAWNIRKALPNLIVIQGCQARELAVDLATTSWFTADVLEIMAGGSANPEADSFVCQDVELFDVVVRFAGHDRVHATGVIPNH